MTLLKTLTETLYRTSIVTLSESPSSNRLCYRTLLATRIQQLMKTLMAPKPLQRPVQKHLLVTRYVIELFVGPIRPKT